MNRNDKNMPTSQTSRPSLKQSTGIDRLYKRTGVKKVSWYYQYPDGTNETLATAPTGDKKAILEADVIAKRKAIDIQQGRIIAGSMGELIDRFETEEDPKHYRDQSKEGKAIRKGMYANLKKFFGQMLPKSVKTIHGYQFVEARAAAGAPAKAWKEIYTFSTICKKAIRWGVMEANPFVDMDTDPLEKDVRTISRSQVLRFYLWTRHQDNRVARLMGCMALFTYLTGFRTAEVRPMLKTACVREGVLAVGAKRKRGEAEVLKMREWSLRLRVVVKRIEQAQVHMPKVPEDATQALTRIAILIAKGHTAKAAAAAVGMKESTYYYWLSRIKKDERIKPTESVYMFPAAKGKCYTKGGLTSSWQETMLGYIRTFDPTTTEQTLVQHREYFSQLDIRPAAITSKLAKRAVDAYDFAAHANPATTHRHYDRRKVRKAGATE
jgi:integrase